MDIGDVRRLSVTALVAAALLLVWLIFLFLQDVGTFTWGWPAGALEALPLQTWLWIGSGLFLVILALLGLSLLGVPEPPGFGLGQQRQVQCQDCKAVFFIQDTGHRPITHICPSCQALGVYSGKEAPVGAPPRPERPQHLVKLDLTCQNCRHRFRITDTGHRPLHVTCPNCKAKGQIR